MSAVDQRLSANIKALRQRIAVACERAGRDPAEVRVVAVTKSAARDVITRLLRLGECVLGENRPQQLLERAAPFPDAQWHLIGQLQRNEVRGVLPVAALIHSVDSLRLLERINLLSAELNLRPRVLLQVNVAGEATKQGFPPDELRRHWAELRKLSHVEVRGLMTMAPYADDPEAARPVFHALRSLRDELRQAADDPHALPELSMGMSGDFEPAIEEGATYVRIGSLLFEGIGAMPAP